MNGIQLILLTGIAFIGLYFAIRLRKRLLDIVLLFAMIICAIIFIIWPDVTNTIAKRVGVGRGADMIFYLSILIFWFITLKLYARIRRLEQLFTQIVREDALKKARN
ncbi:MAG: DUF2304 family protein [Flavisolibacter sp.]